MRWLASAMEEQIEHFFTGKQDMRWKMRYPIKEQRVWEESSYFWAEKSI